MNVFKRNSPIVKHATILQNYKHGSSLKLIKNQCVINNKSKISTRNYGNVIIYVLPLMVTVAWSSQVPLPKSMYRVAFPPGVCSKTPWVKWRRHPKDILRISGEEMIELKELPFDVVPLAEPVIEYISSFHCCVFSPDIHSLCRTDCHEIVPPLLALTI
jgi:hypothetical protein